LKFADDSKLWGKVDNEVDKDTIQYDLNVLSEWANNNQMPFNVDKCKVMHIGNKNSKYEYTLMGKSILSTREEKDLGVFFTENFKSGNNCSRASKSANKIMGLIRRNISNKSAEEMMILYKTLVRPTLEYCGPVWRPYTQKDIVKLEKVQKRYTKMVDGCKNKTYEQRLSRLGILSIEDRFYRADMIQVYNILKDGGKTFPKNFLELNNRLGRKNSRKLFKRRSQLDICKFSFAYRVVDLWNALPDAVVLSPDVNAFKGNLEYFMRDVRGQL
jgi:hypothetical protein